MARRLQVAAADGKIRLWEVESGRFLSTFTAHDGLVLALAFSPQGTVLASGGSDTLARLWEVETARVLSVLRGHTDSVSTLAFSGGR